MESTEMDEEPSKPLGMELQIASEGEDENARQGEINQVAIVNNEHAYPQGAGPQHMGTQGAGVSEYGTGMEWNVDFDVENSSFSETTMTTHLSSIAAHISNLSTVETEQDSNSNFSGMQETGAYPEDDIADADSVQTDSEERRVKEKFNVESLSYELQVGYRILSNLMSASNRCVNKLFLYPVDDTFPETADYYEKIKEPVWMFKMKEKFERQEYNDLTEFMADFRLMIENCYRFNGPDNFVSKKAQKLETMMKQKVALLSRDLREKIMGSASSNSEDDILASAGIRRRVRNPNASSDDPSQQLLSQLRRDRELQEKVDRRQKVEDRKAMEQARLQELQDWEDKMLGDRVKELVKTMWELPQIGLFVYLCMESLGLEEEVTQYQLERGLALPRECTDFKRLMTCLLSTPHQRKSLKSFMPYQVWNEKLSKKVDYFYKVLSDKNGNQIQACYLLGLDTRAFKVMGKRNPLLKKQFHELDYVKRVWILKNYCDFCMETQTYLQRTIDDIEAVRPMDVREVPLGSDGRGYRYINFPMFTGKDIRIYKHPKLSEPTLESLHMEDWSVDSEKMSAASSRCSTPVNPRSSRLAETPSTSLRARALLQAAESKEASPMRDTSRSGSEAPDTSCSVSSTQNLTSDTQEQSSSTSKLKPTNTKKRKRTSLFFSKRKRLKPSVKKTDSNGKGDDESVGDQGEEDDIEDGSASVSNGLSSTQTEEEKNLGQVPESVNSSCDIKSESANSTTSNKTNKSKGSHVTNGSIDTSDKKSVPQQDMVTSRSHHSAMETVCESGTETPLENVSSEDAVSSTNQNSLASGSLNSKELSLSENVDGKHDSAYISGESDSSGKEDRSESASNGDSQAVIDSRSVGEDVDNSCLIKSEDTTTFAAADDGNQSSSQKNSNSEMKKATVRELVPEDKEISKDEVGNEKEDEGRGEMKVPVSIQCSNHIKEEILGDEEGHSGSVTSCDEIKKENGDSKDAVTAKMVINNHGDGQDIKVIHDEPVLPTASVTAGTAVGADKNDLSPLCRDTSKVEVKEEKVSPDDTKMEVVKEEAEDVTAKEEKKDVEEEEEDSDEEDLPDLGRVELIAESMEEIRQLMHKLSNPDPIKRGKRVYPGVIKPCEEELLANLTRFHDELLKYERNLVNARVGMQTKLRKEVESYVEPKVEEAKGWDSDHSQSSKDSSDEEEDSDNKTDTESVKQTRKSKPKSATAALLTSAASRLSNLSGEGNEDSNDSFELDISSRGRLRKRRIIPNNTEDTGLKKRKNLPNQDAFFSTTTATSSPVTSGITTPVTLPNIVQRQPGKPWPSHIISMLTSTTSNSAIKAQLAAQTTRPSGQIVRLVTPGADGTMKTIRVAGKPNMIISPQSLSNIRFISNTGVVTLPRNRVVTSSSAQSSHPVIQQLLLNQARPNVSTSLTTSVMANKSSTPATGLLQKHIAGATPISQSSSPSPVKVSLVITAPSSVSTSSAAKSSVVLGSQPATAAVVVTQVSTSVSQGGKQVLDLGSLSVTQLQQLMKNQAIQINTGAGNSTTLLLTTGLQHLAASRASGAAAGQTPGTVTQVRIPVNQSALQAKPGITGASSLLAMINKAQRPQTTTPQILLNNKLNPLLTFSKQLGPQGVRPQVLTGQTQPGGHVRVTVAASPQSATVVSQGLNTAVLQAALARSLPLNAAGGVLSVVTQPSQVSKSAVPAAATVVTSQKLLSAPRIISSLSSASSSQATTASSSTAAKSAPSSSLVASSSTSRTQSPESMKSRIITVPLVHMSPTCKKYANNVTVKALLENRTTKKNGEEDGVDADTTDLQLSSPVNGSQVSVSDAAAGFTSSDGDGVKKSTLVTTDEPASKNINNATIIKTLQTATVVNESDLSLGAATTQTVPTTLVKSTLAIPSALTLPLSVETAIQPLVSTPVTTSEIILPTMNIKVPSPNTLPSVQHNKNGTTIVHATKVPIPMASEAKTGDSLSPSGTAPPPPPPSSSQLSTVQSVISVPKSQPIVNNNLVILPAATSTLQQPGASPALAVKAPQIAAPRAGLKNVTLKVTPQNGGSGQYVQGFMTPRGLVIPQTAFLQRQQAGNVVLASSSQPGGVAQIQSSPVLAGVSQQNILNITGSGQQGTAALAPTVQQQQPQKVIVAAPNPLTSSSQNQTPLVNQNAGSNLKFVVLNPSSVASSHLTSITPSFSAANQQTSTPAAELVKQIASNSQIQTGVQQKVMNPVALNAGNSQQNTVRLLSSLVQGSGVQQNIGASIQTVGGLAGQSVVNSQTGVSPQLAAQILALQQNNQLQQQQQQQQQQPNIVLTAKPAQSGQSQGVIQSQNKPSVVTLQLQQLGQLFSNIGGVTQLQVAGTPGLQQQQQQQQQQQIASLQQQLGTRLAQPNQVVQLAINPASGSQAILATPQTPQVVRVASQLSPQLQLASQGVAQLQPNGNIVIQQQPTLLSQQQNQSIILQQPGLSQSVVGPSSISLQSSGNQQQLNSLQQQLAKVSQQSVQKPQTLTTNKVQQGSSNLAPGQQMISASQASNLVYTQLQAPTVSLAPSTINQQQQVQFLIPSNASVPSVSISSLTSASSTTNKIPAGTLACASNVNRVIRADSALVQTNLSPQNTGMIGLSTSLAPANGTSQTVVVGSSVNNNTVLTTAKPVQQVIIPNSGAGQFLISPVKLAPQAPQANLVSPIKFVGAVHAQTPGSVLGQSSTQLVVNNQPSNSALPGLQNQMPIKPSVIYAGHPVTATDKKEGKIAQILLSQPISKMNSGQSQIIVNNNQTAAPKLAVSASTSIPAAVPKLGNESNSSLNSKTFLYKIGDQYFSPAAGLNVSNMQVMSQPALPSSVMSTPVTSTTTSKPDVQLLVPPAFIEASDQILKQSSKPLNVSHVPASAVSSGGAVVGADASSNNSGSFAALSQNLAQVMQKGSQHSPGTVDGPSSSALQIPGSVNGIHQGNAQFSFSLSGPSSINNKQVVKPANTVLGNAVSGAQVSPGSVNQSNNAAYQSFNHGPVAAAQSQQLSGSGEPLTRNSSDRIAPRRNTFSGSQDTPGSSKGQTPQRHLSVDDSSLTLEERDEKEAALNLLTLANQQI